MKPATLWFHKTRAHANQAWEFNHLEDGHCANNVPTPKCELHKSVWKGGEWDKKFVWLDNNNKVHHGTENESIC